jgi:hypothetical protein
MSTQPTTPGNMSIPLEHLLQRSSVKKKKKTNDGSATNRYTFAPISDWWDAIIAGKSFLTIVILVDVFCMCFGTLGKKRINASSRAVF